MQAMESDVLDADLLSSSDVGLRGEPQLVGLNLRDTVISGAACSLAQQAGNNPCEGETWCTSFLVQWFRRPLQGTRYPPEFSTTLYL